MSNAQNSNSACERLFGEADSKKIKKDRLYKELLNAGRYGAMDTCVEILKKHRDNPYKSTDELVGELQALVLENYKLMRKSLKLNNIPELTIEQIINSTEADL